MGKALYRKYRSKTLDEIVGQSHVTEILKRSLEKGRVAHAYLLTGPRGIGKTSIARILAHEINKLPYTEDTPHLDIIEIDAASNNGVDDVRDLRDKIQNAPVSAAKKIYIIDEVHMLSKAAFNALLKTLEEPPEHAVFILATTEVHKLPETIVSRTQRFSLRPIELSAATTHLKHIAGKEKIDIDDEALELIAQRGDGSFRDGISLLDQLRGIAGDNTKITRQLVEEALGLAPHETVENLLAAYEQKNLSELVSLLDGSERSGVQAAVLASQLISQIRQDVVAKPQLLPLLDQLLEVPKSSRPAIKLLTVLAAHAIPKPKSAALSAPIPTISSPVAELERQATKPKPSLPKVQTPAKTVGQPAPEPTAATSADAHLNEFDWQELIDYTRKNFVAIYSVLQKCSHEINDSTLVLYTGTNFWKKKLDDSKHRINLSKALTEIGAGNPTIETIGTPPPPKDSQAAAVAAIMGGGEEVTADL